MKKASEKTKTRTRTVRTSVGLIDVLFEEIDNLVDGKTTPQASNAKVALAKAIISAKRLEIESARFIADENRDGKGDVKDVKLGSE